MAEKGKILLLLLLLAITGNGWSQSIPWTVQVTGSNHTLFLNASIQPSYQGQPLETGDAIGIFYDSLGSLKCAGLLEWTQTDGYITAYGNSAGVKGFADQERFKFKLWKKTTNCIVDSVLVSFEPADGALVTATDFYTEGGISQIASLKGMDASITYPKLKYCNNEVSATPTLVGKIPSLTFSAPSGLNMDPNTGIIDPSKSIPSSYKVVFQTSTCIPQNTVTITIVAAPITKLGNDTIICQGTSLNLNAQNVGNNIVWSTGATSSSITVNNAGSYKVQVSNADACMARDTIKVDTYELDLQKFKKQLLPVDCKNTGQLIIDESSIVKGFAPYHYTLTSLYNGKILQSDVPIIPLQDGDYTLSISDRNGCKKTYSETLEITRIDNCDYPVLAPNSTGALSSFFVSYTGIVKIYDKRGTCLKQLQAPAHWDGKDEGGSQVPMGDYYLVSEGQESIIITVLR